MTADVRRRRTCRLCDAPALEPAFSLTPTPIADAFVPPERRDEPQPVYPLDLALCRSCGHLQLFDTVNPDLLFGSYLYLSASSPGLAEHFRGAAARLRELSGLAPGELAVDVGSNDGMLLSFLKESGARVLGVDPAERAARKAAEAGVETLPSYFTSALAAEVRKTRGPAKLVSANNVFAHSDALGDMADGVRALLAPDGAFVFEVSYLADLLDSFVFDYVYHEHLSYHSVKPLDAFLSRHGLELVDAERIATKGGSIRCVAQLRGGPRRRSSALKTLIAREDARGLSEPETYRRFAAAIDEKKMAFRDRLDALGERGLAGYGASPTTTTLLYHFGLQDRLDRLIDDNPLKQGLLSPGLHLPVLAPSALRDREAGTVIVLAWRFADSIIRNNQEHLRRGGRFAIPLPDLRVVG